MAKLKRWYIVIFLLALLIRLVWGLSQLQRGFLFVSEGDYTLYQIGANHFIENGTFDNSLFLTRPPLFPLIIALFQDNHLFLIILNALLGALVAPLTMHLSLQLALPETVGILAGFIMAVEPFHTAYTAFLGPEALSFISALVMLSALVSLQKSDKPSTAIIWAVVAVVAFAISAYSRPSIYLIWTGLSVWIFISKPKLWYAVAIFAVLSFASIQLWVQHNARVFDNPTFSTVSAYTMTYYRAAAVLNQARPDLSIEEVYIEISRRVETRLGGNPDLVDALTQQSYLAASPEVTHALTDVSTEIFRAYPDWYILTFFIGVIRYFNLLPSFPPYENLTNPTMYPTIIYNWVIVGSACFGLYWMLVKRNWLAFWCILLVGGYFTAGTLLVKSAGMTARERAVIIPVIVISASYGLIALYKILKQRYQDKPIMSNSDATTTSELDS